MKNARLVVFIASVLTLASAPQIAKAQDHYDALAVRAAELGGKIFLPSRRDNVDVQVEDDTVSNTGVARISRSIHLSKRHDRHLTAAAKQRASHAHAHIND